MLVEIQDAQMTCPVVQDLVKSLESDRPVSVAEFKNVQSQLVIDGRWHGDALCQAASRR